jgi:hypothetical protein
MIVLGRTEGALFLHPAAAQISVAIRHKTFHNPFLEVLERGVKGENFFQEVFPLRSLRSPRA